MACKRQRPKDFPSSSQDGNKPEYGSQDYWEERYERQFQAHRRNKQQSNDGDQTLAYHAWYFNYDDLRPLLMPLILGGRQEARDLIQENNKAEEEEDDEIKQEEEKRGAADDAGAIGKSPKRRKIENNGAAQEVSKQNEFSDGGDDDKELDDRNELDNCDEWREVEAEDKSGSDDEEEEPMERDGLASNGPISILEIGCGDVPLGTGLALELKELQKETGGSAQGIVRQILCTDYSAVVVDMMKRQYRRIGSLSEKPDNDNGDGNGKSDYCVVDVGDVPLEFEKVDARHLPYDAGSFSLILEKGTLDAMLSNKETGAASCTQIVTECARVLSTGGYLVLISHLNAHTPRGDSWLQEVVFSGLKAGGGANAAWEIEVHGNAEIVQEEEENCALGPPGSAGPAVYIIQKKSVEPEDSEGREQEGDDASNISVKLFSY